MIGIISIYRLIAWLAPRGLVDACVQRHRVETQFVDRVRRAPSAAPDAPCSTSSN
jgi:hypothetical protein